VVERVVVVLPDVVAVEVPWVQARLPRESVVVEWDVVSVWSPRVSSRLSARVSLRLPRASMSVVRDRVCLTSPRSKDDSRWWEDCVRPNMSVRAEYVFVVSRPPVCEFVVNWSRVSLNRPWEVVSSWVRVVCPRVFDCERVTEPSRLVVTVASDERARRRMSLRAPELKRARFCSCDSKRSRCCRAVGWFGLGSVLGAGGALGVVDVDVERGVRVVRVFPLSMRTAALSFEKRFLSYRELSRVVAWGVRFFPKPEECRAAQARM
jgi:hypothetical protein